MKFTSLFCFLAGAALVNASPVLERKAEDVVEKRNTDKDHSVITPKVFIISMVRMFTLKPKSFLQALVLPGRRYLVQQRGYLWFNWQPSRSEHQCPWILSSIPRSPLSERWFRVPSHNWRVGDQRRLNHHSPRALAIVRPQEDLLHDRWNCRNKP